MGEAIGLVYSRLPHILCIRELRQEICPPSEQTLLPTGLVFCSKWYWLLLVVTASSQATGHSGGCVLS